MTLPRSSLASIGSLSARISATSREARSIVDVPVDAISPNPRQPRKTFNPRRLEELAGSVRKNGINQPIRVTLVSPGQYELVSGERRWRAAKIAELREVPAIIDDNLADREKLRFALIENSTGTT